MGNCLGSPVLNNPPVCGTCGKKGSVPVKKMGGDARAHWVVDEARGTVTCKGCVSQRAAAKAKEKERGWGAGPGKSMKKK